jgi:hypothetical protein
MTGPGKGISATVRGLTLIKFVRHEAEKKERVDIDKMKME